MPLHVQIYFIASTMHFCCLRWLATDEDDGQIVRELPVGEHGTLLKSRYLEHVGLCGKVSVGCCIFRFDMSHA